MTNSNNEAAKTREQFVPTNQQYDEKIILETFASRLRQAMVVIRRRNDKWWRNLTTNEPIKRNVGELLILQVSELAEAAEGSPEYHGLLMEITKSICRAMEGHRKKKMDDKLPHRPMYDVELADVLIRLLDTAEGTGADLAGSFLEKMEYNRTREDHTIEARLAPGGKAY